MRFLHFLCPRTQKSCLTATKRIKSILVSWEVEMKSEHGICSGFLSPVLFQHRLNYLSELDSKSDALSNAKSSRSRMVLSNEQAREIFTLKGNHGFSSSHSASLHLASKYNVSSKAIRDIWKGRSWLEATFNLWEIKDRPPKRTLGRPKGRKDSKPRISKLAVKSSRDSVHRQNSEINKIPNFQHLMAQIARESQGNQSEIEANGSHQDILPVFALSQQMRHSEAARRDFPPAPVPGDDAWSDGSLPHRLPPIPGGPADWNWPSATIRRGSVDCSGPSGAMFSATGLRPTILHGLGRP